VLRVGGIGHHVDADAGDITQPGNLVVRHRGAPFGSMPDPLPTLRAE
jgi:hypothetical protein